jgi:hypothetical protein
MRRQSPMAAPPRWFTVEATKTVSSGTMHYESRTEVQVFANNETHAIRLVRIEFKFFHLKVIA